MRDISSEVTVFVIATERGRNYAECLKALSAQSIRFKLEEVMDVYPMAAAFQAMIDRCTTPFYIQIDEDMILHPRAIAHLYNRMVTSPAHTPIVVCWLRDVHLCRDIQGVKIYRHGIFKRYPYNLTSGSEEVEQLDRMLKDGYYLLNDETVVGLHCPYYTHIGIFERYFNLMQKHKVFNYAWTAEVPSKLATIYAANPSTLNLYALRGATTGLCVDRYGARDARVRQPELDRLIAEVQPDPTPVPAAPMVPNFEVCSSELRAKPRRVKVLKLIDQFGWAYHFIALEQQRVSRHQIDYVRLVDCTPELVAQYDVFYLSAPTLGIEKVNQLIKDVRTTAPYVKIIGAYAGETPNQYCDCDMVLAISLKQLPDLVKLYPDKVAIFLPEGVDVDFFSPSTYGYPDEFKVGYAGRLGPPKRVHLLQQLDYPVRLQAQHGMGFFVEDRSLAPMRDFYHSISCLVMTSSSECMPRVVLEAMACGVPVVSTDVGSLSMLLPDFWRVPVNPEPAVLQEMNSRLRSLAQDPGRRARVGARNRKLVVDKFSWQVLEPIWDDVFEYAAEGRLWEAKQLGKRVLAELRPAVKSTSVSAPTVKGRADVILLLPEDTPTNRQITQRTIDQLHSSSSTVDFNVIVIAGPAPKSAGPCVYCHPDRTIIPPAGSNIPDVRFHGASAICADKPFDRDREIRRAFGKCTSEFAAVRDYNTVFQPGWYEEAIAPALKPVVPPTINAVTAPPAKVAIISANLGGIDADGKTAAAQVLPAAWRIQYKYFTDSDMPPRPLSISSRMQSKLPKMLGFDYCPDADLIIWLDSAYVIKSPNFVEWMVAKLGDGDICLMPHQARHSIAEELAFVQQAMPGRNKYLRSRYAGEPMAEQVSSYLSDPTFKDNHLAAAGCFIYRPTAAIKAMLRDWLLECYRWTVQDQFSLMYMLHKHNITPRWLDATVRDCPHLTYTNHKGPAPAQHKM